jgi:hypothetical protein
MKMGREREKSMYEERRACGKEEWEERTEDDNPGCCISESLGCGGRFEESTSVSH